LILFPVKNFFACPCFFIDHPTAGYRRLTYMIIDEDVVAVSAATVYRVLSRAGLLGKRQVKPSLKGKGVVQPLKAHEHWHIDVCYLNLGGPQFVAKDFKEFIRLIGCGMTHVRTSPFYPQSNGKQERMQGLVKQECIRPKCPQDVDEARKIMAEYVQYYNNKRLHSSIGYVAPVDMLQGRQKEILNEREQKLQEAREQRKAKKILKSRMFS
jgi:putative transposase